MMWVSVMMVLAYWLCGRMGSVDIILNKVIITLNEGTMLSLSQECKRLLFFSAYIHSDKSFTKQLGIQQIPWLCWSVPSKSLYLKHQLQLESLPNWVWSNSLLSCKMHLFSAQLKKYIIKKVTEISYLASFIPRC